jgi:hypothetical protein
MSGRGPKQGNLWCVLNGVESEDLEEAEAQEGIGPGRGVTLTFQQRTLARKKALRAGLWNLALAGNRQ